MRMPHSSLLAETIYDAAVDPALWTDVMRLFNRRFSTGAEALYFLDYKTNALQTVHVEGVGDKYLLSFRECFYRSDNPFTRSAPLHRTGAIRTDEQVAAFLGDPHALLRSKYYNDWMRPQDLAHTMGTTLLEEDGRILNFSLLRSGDRGGFRSREIAAFERLCGHLARAIRLAIRLESMTARRTMSEEALERLGYGVAVLSGDGRLLHCNGTIEAMLIRSDGISLRGGRLFAQEAGAQEQLKAVLHDLALGPDKHTRDIVLPRRHGGPPLILSAVRLSSGRLGATAGRPCILVTVADSSRRRAADATTLSAAYGLTQAEARLAQSLAQGLDLHRSADASGITYETARWYLKLLFQKTGTRRQADLIAKLHAVSAPFAEMRPPVSS